MINLHSPGSNRLLTLGADRGTTDTLDLALVLDMYLANVSFGQLRNCLTEIDSDGSLIGELAESWDATPDAKTYLASALVVQI